MPTTLTLKNIPDAVFARLKLTAEQNRRSLNSEAIACLGGRAAARPGIAPTSGSPALARCGLPCLPAPSAPQDIAAAQRKGRP